jgi:hypothetical protein
LINDGGNDNYLNEAPKAKTHAGKDEGVLQALDNNQVEFDLEGDDKNSASLRTRRNISKNGNNKLDIAMQHYEQKKNSLAQ